MSLRVRRMMKRLNSEDEDFVNNEITISEEAHSAITRRHFGVNWQDPEHYDLVLNTERISIEECMDEVLALVNIRSSRKQRIHGRSLPISHWRRMSAQRFAPILVPRRFTLRLPQTAVP